MKMYGVFIDLILIFWHTIKKNKGSVRESVIYRRKIQNIFENRLNGILIHENVYFMEKIKVFLMIRFH